MRLAVRSVAICLITDRDRWVLWLPVGLGAGIGLYFALPAEPSLLVGAALTAAVVIAGVAGAGPRERRRWGFQIAALAVGVAAAGFTMAQVRTAMVKAPVLTNSLGPTSVAGRIVRVETLPDGVRLTLDQPEVSGLNSNETPEGLRVRLRGDQPKLHPGDRVRLRAVLNPPPQPAAPGAFDFQRQAFYESLGAVGFAMAPAEIIATAEEGGFRSLRLWFAGLRLAVGERVGEHVRGATGAVVVALLTGERGEIPQPVMANIRDSGLAHLLAISGLHIGLLAGLVFLGTRAILSLVPPLALRFPIKKWAAVASIVGAGAYVLLAGATVPSQRAFLMIGLVLLAVLVDRRGLSMRLVAWAALIILLFQPESLLGPSFQMSFAAVVALVATYERVSELRRTGREPPTIPGKALRYLGGVALTTLVAGLATAPLAAFHFNSFADYGLVANLVAVPATALWIMPWALISLMLMPFGLAGWALVPMGWGVDVVLWVAGEVASWPGAVTLLPTMPTWGLVSIVLGGLWLCLWRGRWRLWGLVGIGVGMATVLFVDVPDVLVDGRGKLLAVRTGDGDLAVSSGRAAPFSRNAWLRKAGQQSVYREWPRSGFSEDGRLGCDSLGCIYRTAGHVVALVRSPEALIEDCRTADVVIGVVPVRGPCPSAQAVIDRFDLWRDGTHALWLTPGGIRIENVNEFRGNRPWVVRPAPRKDRGNRPPPAEDEPAEFR